MCRILKILSLIWLMAFQCGISVLYGQKNTQLSISRIYDLTDPYSLKIRVNNKGQNIITWNSDTTQFVIFNIFKRDPISNIDWEELGSLKNGDLKIFVDSQSVTSESLIEYSVVAMDSVTNKVSNRVSLSSLHLKSKLDIYNSKIILSCNENINNRVIKLYKGKSKDELSEYKDFDAKDSLIIDKNISEDSFYQMELVENYNNSTYVEDIFKGRALSNIIEVKDLFIEYYTKLPLVQSYFDISDNLLHIFLSLPDTTGFYEFAIFDTVGKCIQRGLLSSDDHNVTLNIKMKGLYLIRLTNGKKATTHKLLIP